MSFKMPETPRYTKSQLQEIKEKHKILMKYCREKSKKYENNTSIRKTKKNLVVIEDGSFFSLLSKEDKIKEEKVPPLTTERRGFHYPTQKDVSSTTLKTNQFSAQRFILTSRDILNYDDDKKNKDKEEVFSIDQLVIANEKVFMGRNMIRKSRGFKFMKYVNGDG